jgi:molybdopterin-containing oxidoreductase family iron-sulfur binding subunit
MEPSTDTPRPVADTGRLVELADDCDPSGMLLPGEELGTSRRAFLRMTGFGLSSALLAGCSRGPVQKLLPALAAPEHTTAGSAYWIATGCHGCEAACGVLAKCRDGRPIKLEGNPEHAISRGGLCSVGQAEVLSLYDSKRIGTPLLDGAGATWEAADERLRSLLAELDSRKGTVRLLTGTVTSPSTRAAARRFVGERADARHVSYDPLSVSAILDAHERTHGVRALPTFRFGTADLIVSFDADFLGTWISPVSHARAYVEGRRPDGPDAQMSRHVQLEARLSLTGAAADERRTLPPSQMPAVLARVCAELEARAGGDRRLRSQEHTGEHEALAAALAAELWEARGRSLVVCGLNDVDAQVLTAYANHLLGSYGRTLSVARASLQRAGDDRGLIRLREELDAGAVDLLIVSGVNPAYDLPHGFADSLRKAGKLVVLSSGQDETAAMADIVLPASHSLEAWDDAEPERDRFTLTQPTVPPLHGGRTLRHTLLAWCGDERDDAALLRDFWKTRLHERLASSEPFDAFFDRALHDGYVEREETGGPEPGFRADAVIAPAPGQAEGGLELVLYPKVGLLDGRHAHNPWLQELPDPISKVVWDNYACLSAARAEALGVEQGDIVRLSAGDGGPELELPVIVQPGQHDDVVAVALGYGRRGTDRFAGVGPRWLEGEPTVAAGGTIGVNAAPLLHFHGGTLRTNRAGLGVQATGRSVDVATTQDHHRLELPEHLVPREGAERRDFVHIVPFEEYQHDPSHAVPHTHHADADLWPKDHPKPEHHWGMAIDLASCTGCSACVVSCQAENNVPVVGRDEVLRHREMHWLRIDRYFEGHGEDTGASHQPMLCQQCDNAPCESVCPVLATVHSTEGLNQQVYNRCVGTRYCANTCPYKTRRFNWFEYPREDELQNHALNPDVTVRSRGVMEKCSFCAQRIQEAKNEAARLGRPLADGDIKAACQQSCPTQAIVFGDLTDEDSEVVRRSKGPRAYGVLTELNVKPSVRYLSRVRNVRGEGNEEGSHDG